MEESIRDRAGSDRRRFLAGCSSIRKAEALSKTGISTVFGFSRNGGGGGREKLSYEQGRAEATTARSRASPTTWMRAGH